MKKFEKYWDESIYRYVYDDGEFECFDDMIQSRLNWCGCGAPDIAQESIMKALRHIHNLKELVHTDQISWQEWNKQGIKLFGEWEYVIYYMLDEKELTEHGSSVPGWLTEEGIELLEELESFYITNEGKEV